MGVIPSNMHHAKWLPSMQVTPEQRCAPRMLLPHGLQDLPGASVFQSQSAADLRAAEKGQPSVLITDIRAEMAEGSSKIRPFRWTLIASQAGIRNELR